MLYSPFKTIVVIIMTSQDSSELCSLTLGQMRISAITPTILMDG